MGCHQSRTRTFTTGSSTTVLLSRDTMFGMPAVWHIWPDPKTSCSLWCRIPCDTVSDTEQSDRPITIGNATKFKHVTYKLKTIHIFNNLVWCTVHATGYMVKQICLDQNYRRLTPPHHITNTKMMCIDWKVKVAGGLCCYCYENGHLGIRSWSEYV